MNKGLKPPVGRKRSMLGIWIFLIVTVMVACKSSVGPAKEGKPNIILLYADDLGWTDLGMQGSDFYETPAIDGIAKEGIQFTNAYANASNCAPSRACLISGLYTPRHGIYTVNNSDRGNAENRKLIPIKNTTVLDRSFQTLPESLKKNGYATCMAGKWHLSSDPLPYGFDENFGGYERGHPASYFSPYKNPALTDGDPGEHLPDRLSREVSNWIKKNADTPFFVYLPFYSVHTPIQARQDLIGKYVGKPAGQIHDHVKYAAMIEAMDQAVAKILATVEELGLSENTMVIFTSDNGPNGGVSLARPLRGTKGMYYEGGIRVPFYVKWPKAVLPGMISSEPITGMDIFPTLLDIIKNAERPDLDGESLLPLLKGAGSLEERELYWHFPAYLQVGKNNRAYREAHTPGWRATPCSVIRDGDWKLIEYFESGELQLFNLKNDPGERQDLSDVEIEKRNELYAKLSGWREDTKAPVPTEINPEYTGTTPSDFGTGAADSR